MHAPCARGTAPAARVHLELFARGFVVIVPARIGLRSTTCRAHVWTSDPTGIVHFDRPETLGDLFAVWGEPLTPVRLLSFHGSVSLYRNGVLVGGDPRSLPLRDGDELVLEVGRHIAPHRSYRFPAHRGSAAAGSSGCTRRWPKALATSTPLPAPRTRISAARANMLGSTLSAIACVRSGNIVSPS